MEYILTFKNTNHAMKAEKCLIDKKLEITVLPLPSEIEAGCGLCLKISPEEIDSALTVLSDNNISEISVYSRQKINGNLIVEKNKFFAK